MILLRSAEDRSWSALAHCKGQRPAVACTEVPNCKAIVAHGFQQVHCKLLEHWAMHSEEVWV